MNNLKANGGKIAISVYDAQSLEGYQIKGTAEYLTDGDIVTAFKAMVEKMFNGAATAKGALLITPEKVIVTTPGADNKKVL
ncbi:MAG: pyridoxamine 5'-phosphate oxidase family protein [Lachnospiraceae bacterium]|nr:pyridoxamine 5'-phosphate oxidase family protein [Lachnospiraceae bacterium]